METQIEKAILVAYDPFASQELKAQAFGFFNQLRANPQGWPSCLALALKVPKSQDVVRHGCLEVVINAISSGAVDDQGLSFVRENLMSYIKKEYWKSETEGDSYAIENKTVQLLTFLFVKTYETRWPTFLQDILDLCSPPDTTEVSPKRGIRLYLRTLSSLHDEIGDTLVIRNLETQNRANDLKDLIRVRDVSRIAQSWMELLPIWYGIGRDIFNECLVVIGKWATWIDLSLVVTERFLSVLVPSIMAASDTDAAEDASFPVTAMLEILGKKMRPEDKLELLSIFKVQQIVQQLSNSTRLHDRFSSDYDTDLAELVAKVVNSAVFELVCVADSRASSADTVNRANEQIRALLPYLLRYFSDDFDEVCSTVIPSLTDLLTFIRRRNDQYPEWTPMLPAVLQAVIAKMKYDDTSDWGSNDSGTEEAEFQELRKKLETLQQTIANIDEEICVQTVTGIVLTAFDSYQSQQTQVNWRVLDLALYEMYIFGITAQKNGALYSKSKPVTPAAEALIQMLVKMVESRIANFSHPSIQLQYMELCVRYWPFFDNNPQYIPSALENFSRFVHHDHVKVKQRSWYLFFRFTKSLRPHVGGVARTIIESIGPLLTIKVELPKEARDDDDASSEGDSNPDSKFQSQLYLYEAVGSISSANSVSITDQMFYVKAVLEPQFTDLQSQIPAAKRGDQHALLHVHHIISALGTLAHGFMDSTPSAVKRSSPVAVELSAEFTQAAEAILLALASLSPFIQVRDAARTAFARLLGVLGSNILPQLPRWFGGLLVLSSSKDEIASFLRLLGQVIFAFNAEIYSFLNDLLSPLLERVLLGIAEPTSGTDDEIQLVELKTHYLAFLQVILGQGLGSVLVSEQNQRLFETVISSIEHFTKDPDDLLTAKMALQVLTKITEVWGGPDVAINDNIRSQPNLPGFDRFMLERFSGLAWALPNETSFDPRDGKSRQVLTEAAGLQKQILAKTGTQYLTWLRTQELKTLGMDDETIENYVNALSTMDVKGFRQYFVRLTQTTKP